MANTYSFKDFNKDNMARAMGRSTPVSFKQSVEICNFIRGKKLNLAKQVLNRIIKKKQALPFKRFNSDIGHKKGMAAGRYPGKASREVLDLLNLVEANAQFKGLNTSNLIICHINANKASTTMRFGRKRSRRAKRTNFEIIVQEKAGKKEEKKKVPEIKKTDVKKESGKNLQEKQDPIKEKVIEPKIEKKEEKKQPTKVSEKTQDKKEK